MPTWEVPDRNGLAAMAFTLRRPLCLNALRCFRVWFTLITISKQIADQTPNLELLFYTDIRWPQLKKSSLHKVRQASTGGRRNAKL